MNTIFIDINQDLNNEKKDINQKSFLDKISNVFSHFVFKEDLISSNYSSNYYLEINSNIILYDELKKRKKRTTKKIVRKISKSFKTRDVIYVILSEPIINNMKYYNYMVEIFEDDKLENYNIIFAEVKNELLENDVKYIDKFILENKLPNEKVKLLVALDNLEQYNETKITQYISRFKYVDILRFSDMSKFSYKKLVAKIDAINDEYGSSITCIQRRNIQDYNVYISYADYSKKAFKKKYITNRDSLYINMCDPNEDIFSEAYKNFKNNEVDLNILFKRLNIKIENFSRVKLGNWLTL